MENKLRATVNFILMPFFMHDNKVVRQKPSDITVTPIDVTCRAEMTTVKELKIHYRFYIGGHDVTKTSYEVFETKEELLKSL